MKKLLNKIVPILRFSIIILAAVALSLNGVGAAQRLYTNYDNINEKEPVDGNIVWLVAGPPAPDEIPGNMESKGKPNCEELALISAPLLIKAENSENENQIPDDGLENFGILLTKSVNTGILITTFFQVSPRVGEQFTLVGAKPSGTS